MAKKIQRSVSRPRPADDTRSGAAQGRQEKRPSGRRVGYQAVTDFTVQLSTLIRAGIPVVRALKVLEGQTPQGPLRTILGELVEDVSSGTPLSEAMGKHGRAFDSLFAAMIRAGESGGVLDLVLARIAGFRTRAAELRAKVGGAMLYPLVVLLVTVLVVSVVVVWVIPRFTEVFNSFGLELPRLTRGLLAVSDFVVQYWYLVFGAPVVFLFVHFAYMRRAGRYRRFVHGRMLRLPLLGRVLSLAQIAAFARTFGTLVQTGVPHLDALAITRDTTSNDVLAEAVEDVRRVVREGEGIARPMAASGAFDNLVVSMVEVGEQTGELDRMLIDVADAYDAQVTRRLDAFFRVLEPALLVFIAAFVGVVVVALFLPLLELMQGIGSN